MCLCKKERECVHVCVWCCLCHWKCWGVQLGYFWISDSVSMAADASQRKALRYQQTLVGPNLPVCLCAALSVSENVFCLLPNFMPVHLASPSSLHLPTCLLQPCQTIHYPVLSPSLLSQVLMDICFNLSLPFMSNSAFSVSAVILTSWPIFQKLNLLKQLLNTVPNLCSFHTTHAVEHLLAGDKCKVISAMITYL